MLTHEGIVKAIQECFQPVLVVNNRPGKDAELLQRFGEPSWNYQVIRFLDGDGADLIPRRDRVWTVGGVATRMVAALEAAGKKVPGYLREIVEQ